MFDTVIMLSSGWGSRFGGINAFNYDLARAFQQICAAKIICVVPDEPTPHREETDPEILTFHTDSAELSVNDSGKVLQVLGDYSRSEPLWIGHDMKTGETAIACRNNAGGKALIFHHMNYEAYYTQKRGDGSETAHRLEAQSKLLSQADYVGAVGPRLARSARRRLKFSETELDVVEIIPGLADITPCSVAPEDFIAITFGRLNREDDRIKMGKLAAAGFGRFIASVDYRDLRDPTLYVIGVDEDQATRRRQTEQLTSLASEEAGRNVNVMPIPFLTDRDNLLAYLRNSSVCMMLSVHEGFGLVGWEAIAAGVPLILSRESGLYDFIQTEGKKPATGCVYPVMVRGHKSSTSDKEGGQSLYEEDIESVADALKEVHRDPEVSKDAAIFLKDMMSKHTWQNAAKRIARRFDVNMPVPHISVGLACGFPDVNLYGKANDQPSDKSQMEYREYWKTIGIEVGRALSEVTEAEIEIHHGGVDGGNLSTKIIEAFVDRVGTNRVVTHWHKEFSTEEEALAEIQANYPQHFEKHNVELSRPYINLVGTVVHVSTIARRRYNLSSRVDALIAASGSFAVRELIEYAIEKKIPIALIGVAGGAALEEAKSIKNSNIKIIKSSQHREAIEMLANPSLEKENFTLAIEKAVKSLSKTVLEMRD